MAAVLLAWCVACEGRRASHMLLCVYVCACVCLQGLSGTHLAVETMGEEVGEGL